MQTVALEISQVRKKTWCCSDRNETDIYLCWSSVSGVNVILLAGTELTGFQSLLLYLWFTQGCDLCVSIYRSSLSLNLLMRKWRGGGEKREG